MPNTISQNLARLQAAKTAIGNAITAKGGTVAVGDGLEDFPTAIATIPSGGVSANGVTFYDYDGTVTNSYSKEEFLELSAMPANPMHEGLTAQGWNWSLADAKAYVTKYGQLNIGQMYITSDGKTRIKIKLEEGRLSPVLGLGINGTVDVDWGDDTTHGEMTGSDVLTLVQLQHVYAAAGEYTIALAVTGEISFLGDFTYKSKLLQKSGVTGANESQAYINAVECVFVGNGVLKIRGYAFSYSQNLKHITIPRGVTSLDGAAFTNTNSLTHIDIPDTVTTIDTSFTQCYSLKSVTIPDSVTSIATNLFTQCYSLESITIPDSVTSIGNNAFQSCNIVKSVDLSSVLQTIGNNAFQLCYSMTTIDIPDSVTSIGNNAFISCYSLVSIKFENATPPAAGGSDTFTGIPTDCIIYVPEGSLEDYESETNYPDPDVYTYVEY